MFFTSEKEIEQRILDNNSYVKTVTVQKIFPQTIHITITEEIPIAVLKSGDGYFYVSEKGKILEKERSLKRNIPLVTYYQLFYYYSYYAGDFITFKDFLASLRILKHVGDLGFRVDTIDINSLSMIVLQVRDKKLLFTTEKDINTQLYEFEKVVYKFKIEGKEFKSLDVRFDKPVVIY